MLKSQILEATYFKTLNVYSGFRWQRMSWAATCHTIHLEEMAYCVLDIFDVNMPMLCGEGSRALLKLQEEIVKNTNDFRLLTWTAA